MKLVELGTILHMDKGKKPQKQQEKYKEGYLPYVDIQAFEEGIIKSYADPQKCLLCEDGDLLIVCDGSRSGLTGRAIKGVVGSTLSKISADGLCTEYLQYFIQSKYTLLNTRKKGTGTPHLNAELLKKSKLVIPTQTEQERIVSKIEELFSKLDASVAELKTAKEKLKVYRQAVLKEAFASAMQTGVVEISEIVDDIRIGPFGTALHKADYISGGIPVINPQHISGLSINANTKVTISREKAAELASYRLEENDIIMGRRGEMGRVAPVTNAEAGWICGTGSIIFRLKPEYDAFFYAQILSAPNIVHYLEDNATGTTMKNLNENIVKHIPVPKITRELQKDIVSNLEAQSSVCDSIEQTIDISLQQAEALRQSILKQAFEGRLI